MTPFVLLFILCFLTCVAILISAGVSAIRGRRAQALLYRPQ